MRIAATAACLAVAAVPAVVLVSQNRLDDSADAFAQGNCREAIDKAGSSIAALGFRPEPYEVRAFCRLRQGRRHDAILDLERAIDRDPQNWTYRYDLAVARASAGLDPRRAAVATLRLNPMDAEALEMAKALPEDSAPRLEIAGEVPAQGARPFYLSER